ncbi:hypothetical protein [Streptomyces sp. SCL15-4]|uniref:hypothetical protein n=1 Tax=Streptomyces sp. SCL15-4 TaxID=2967221 RepID=UPI0029660436|nr:hypothetical protein [Streptomyces sp. SCL15-4]
MPAARHPLDDLRNQGAAVTFHYRDTDGDLLVITAGRNLNGQPVLHFAATPDGVDVPLDRIEELIAGARDTARQAAAQEQPSTWERRGGFDQHDDYRTDFPVTEQSAPTAATRAADNWERQEDDTWTMPISNGGGVLIAPSQITPDERARLAAAWPKENPDA